MKSSSVVRRWSFANLLAVLALAIDQRPTTSDCSYVFVADFFF